MRAKTWIDRGIDFDRFDAGKSIFETKGDPGFVLSTSMDRGVDFDGIDVEKSMFENKGEITCAQAKNCSVPENRNSSISLGKIIETQ